MRGMRTKGEDARAKAGDEARIGDDANGEAARRSEGDGRWKVGEGVRARSGQARDGEVEVDKEGGSRQGGGRYQQRGGRELMMQDSRQHPSDLERDKPNRVLPTTRRANEGRDLSGQ